ncbi:uncharacterized protein LOC116030926 [Ipomoea triloba]|uniref:uncharacterized protein LOC116030926 n=1 Tax=Ipomoea triloba TaxID=35885 RepID=UPI00125DC86F|nr:uncharacterized protein LOC116030926 [Ipomoea triloba]
MESPKSSVGSCPSPPSKTDTGGTSSEGKRSLDDTMDIGGSTEKSPNQKLKDAIINVLETINATMSSREQSRKAREEAGTMSYGDISSDSSSDSDDDCYVGIILVGVAYLLLEEEESESESEDSM